MIMSQKRRILIIDDDRKLNKVLQDYLSPFGFEVLAAARADEGLWSLRTSAPELIILDVMIPGMSGFELCKLIRQDTTVPIIMLTARGEVTDRIVGLELGANDCAAQVSLMEILKSQKEHVVGFSRSGIAAIRRNTEVGSRDAQTR